MSDVLDPPAGSAAAVAAGALTRLRVLRHGVEERQQTEALALKLAAVTEPHRLSAVLEEVERRAEVFAAAQQTSSASYGPPKLRALGSVLDDVTFGRFG